MLDTIKTILKNSENDLKEIYQKLDNASCGFNERLFLQGRAYELEIFIEDLKNIIIKY